jgi:hypothetical protein
MGWEENTETDCWEQVRNGMGREPVCYNMMWESSLFLMVLYYFTVQVIVIIILCHSTVYQNMISYFNITVFEIRTRNDPLLPNTVLLYLSGKLQD